MYGKDEIFVCDNVEAFRIILKGYLGAFACNRLYKKEVFDKIRFRSGQVVGEDGYLNIWLAQQVKTVAIDTRPYYYYLYRPDSVSTSQYNKNDMGVI